MTMQYVNLLNPALRARRDPLGLPLAAGLAATALVIVGGLSAVAGQQKAAAQHRLAQANAAAKQVQAELTELGNRLAARQADPRLAQELARVQVRIDDRQGILAALESGGIGNTEGFSGTMRAFARQTANGVWLTGFTVNEGGRQMRIAGRVLDPRLVPGYLDRLNAEKAFSGRIFAALEMKASAEKPAAEPPRPAPPALGPLAAKPVPPKPELRYTEFVLATTGLVGEGGKR